MTLADFDIRADVAGIALWFRGEKISVWDSCADAMKARREALEAGSAALNQLNNLLKEMTQ